MCPLSEGRTWELCSQRDLHNRQVLAQSHVQEPREYMGPQICEPHRACSQLQEPGNKLTSRPHTPLAEVCSGLRSSAFFEASLSLPSCPPPNNKEPYSVELISTDRLPSFSFDCIFLLLSIILGSFSLLKSTKSSAIDAANCSRIIPRYPIIRKLCHRHETTNSKMPSAEGAPRTLYDKVLQAHIVDEKLDGTLLLYIGTFLYYLLIIDSFLVAT